MKSIKILLSVLVLLVLTTSRVTANESNQTIEPRYQATCSGGGKHYMVAKSAGIAYGGGISNPGPRLINGQASQCNKCYLTLVTEYNPYWSGYSYPGKYAMQNPGYTVGSGVTMFNASVSSLYTSASANSFWQGFEFYAN